MQRIAKYIDEYVPEGCGEWQRIERDFTEIIAQVTPGLQFPNGSFIATGGSSDGAYRGIEQARCPECKAPLDAVTPHVSGCAWQAEQARQMRPSTRTYGNELTNAYRPTITVVHLQSDSLGEGRCGFRYSLGSNSEKISPDFDEVTCSICRRTFCGEPINTLANLKAAQEQKELSEWLAEIRLPDGFPQQPEEPAPASWWSRVKRMFR